MADGRDIRGGQIRISLLQLGVRQAFIQEADDVLDGNLCSFDDWLAGHDGRIDHDPIEPVVDWAERLDLDGDRLAFRQAGLFLDSMILPCTIPRKTVLMFSSSGSSPGLILGETVPSMIAEYLAVPLFAFRGTSGSERFLASQPETAPPNLTLCHSDRATLTVPL